MFGQARKSSSLQMTFRPRNCPLPFRLLLLDFMPHPISVVYPAIPPYREPPRAVLHAMKNAEVVIACSTTPIASEVIEEALKAGTRILSMFRITIDALCRTVPIDYRELGREMKRIKRILDASRLIEISSAGGTHLRVRMANRPTMLALGSVENQGRLISSRQEPLAWLPLKGLQKGKSWWMEPFLDLDVA